MKILMTTDTVGGVWVYSLELCKSLQKLNVEVHLVAMGAWPTEAQEEEASTLGNVTLYKSDYKLEWMQDPWEDVEKSRKWINSIYHTISPDIVHLNNYAHVGEDWECPVLTVFHSCVQTWWQAVKGTSAPAQFDKYREVVKDSLQESDVVVSPTQTILEKAKSSHGFTSETRVIYNGRDWETTEEKEKEDIILCLGRVWDEAKNLELLSKIAADLPWPVYIAGNNTNPSTGTKKEIPNVNILGNLSPSEVKDWMLRAKIFVSPTKYEPFGLAILEAAKANCALVLSEIDTLNEIWNDSAAFFDPNNPEDAKQNILRLISDETLLKEQADKARERSSNYGSDRMAKEYFDLYQELIQKQNANKLLSV